MNSVGMYERDKENSGLVPGRHFDKIARYSLGPGNLKSCCEQTKSTPVPCVVSGSP